MIDLPKKLEYFRSLPPILDKDVKVHPHYPDYIITQEGLVYTMKESYIRGDSLRQRKPFLNKYGVNHYVLKSIQGTQTTVAAHHLVAFLYLPNPDGLHQIIFKDGNKSNPDYQNLERSIHQGKRNSKPTALTPFQEDEVRQKYLKGANQKTLAQEYGVGLNTIGNTIRNRGENISRNKPVPLDIVGNLRTEFLNGAGIDLLTEAFDIKRGTVHGIVHNKTRYSQEYGKKLDAYRKELQRKLALRRLHEHREGWTDAEGLTEGLKPKQRQEARRMDEKYKQYEEWLEEQD